jgi:phospholipid N-methyltransferase
VPLQIENAKLVVELGPGTGPVTEVILHQMPKDCEYIGIEMNADMIKMLDVRFHEHQFILDSAENINKILGKY